MKENYQPSTADHHNSLIRKHLLPTSGDKQMREIDEEAIGEFLDRVEATLSGNTLQNLYGLLHRMFRVACEYKIIKERPRQGADS
ncbi:MAG TPA: hypothetical protein VNO70_10840 [Blastocatellia bacterium]|nr:hypothetical protein [Blastocatellia bacterium]